MMIRNNQIQIILRCVAFSTGLLLMAAPAAMADSAADGAREQHACAVIIGLNQSEALYDACIKSLDRSLATARPQGTEAEACAYVGLGSSTECASDLRAMLWNEKNIGDR
jgi:hypothetical protein